MTDLHGQSGDGWIAVDLDGTLAQYDRWKGADHIGRPIPYMLERVKNWLADGREVRILTARVSPETSDDPEGAARRIQEWCIEHLGQPLTVTNEKDAKMREYYDDRCKQVIPNVGVAIEQVLYEISRSSDDPDQLIELVIQRLAEGREMTA